MFEICQLNLELFLVHGRQCTFALDNIDFQEDTPDGKKTLHATVSVASQADESNDGRYTRVPILKAINDIILKDKTSVYKMMTCTVPPSSKPVYPSFLEYESMDLDLDMNINIKRFTLLDYASMLAVGIQADREEDKCFMPVWSAFNCDYCSKQQHLAKIKVIPLPLLDAKVNDYSSMLTIMSHMNVINAEICGPDEPTVIAMDMDLYLRAKLMTMVHHMGQKIVLRIGELHVVMAMLRTIGAALEGSGLEEVFMKADIYGSATLRHILAGNHVSRGIETHTTLVAISSVFLCWKALAVEKP